jgi:hexosaminidase
MAQTNLSIIPVPEKVEPLEGAFVVNTGTRIHAPELAKQVAHFLASLLRASTGASLPVDDTPETTANAIALVIDPDAAPGNEGYVLRVSPDRVEILAAHAQGLFYGVQTLRQLLPAEVERDAQVREAAWAIPAVSIEDAPRFRWRGLHLDVGRHMYSVEFIKKFLDLMALYKLNVFHWHLTEDQGWRIEIKQYPKLTEIGSKRAASPLPADRNKLDGKPYGGYYTQDEIKEVQAYAQERFITIVPEIEMPGHAVAALASYPELGCVGKDYTVYTYWGITEDVFCAGNEEVFSFLENVLTEVLDLFPGEYIHIGGDECPKARWEACPKCQERIRQEGLKDEHELQSYFIRRIEKFLNAHGRRLIGWDEILEGGLAPNATVMSWRGAAGGIEAAEAGHDVVMTPNVYCYFDYYQSEDQENEPPAIGGYLPLSKVYAFEPTAGISEDKAHRVLGGQGNIWTEYMPTSEQVEYMAYPRALALSEVLWSTPAAQNYDDFFHRLAAHLQRLDQLDVNYRKP